MAKFKPVTFYSKNGKSAVANNQKQYDHYMKTMGWSTTPPSSKSENLPATGESELTPSQAYKPMMLKKSDKKENEGKPSYKNLMAKKFSKGGSVKVTYNKGGGLKKAVKKNQEEKYLTKDKKGKKVVTDSDLIKAKKEAKGQAAPSGEQAGQKVDSREATANIKAANANLKELRAQYKALSPEDRKGEKGKALISKIRTEQDSKRGQSKYDRDTGTTASGKVRVLTKPLKV